MKLLRRLAKGAWGVAKGLLPIVALSAISKYRQKNPKHGWLVDAVESAVLRIDTDPGMFALSPNEKADYAAKQVQNDFPDVDYDTAAMIARLHLQERKEKKP